MFSTWPSLALLCFYNTNIEEPSTSQPKHSCLLNVQAKAAPAVIKTSNMTHAPVTTQRMKQEGTEKGGLRAA